MTLAGARASQPTIGGNDESAVRRFVSSQWPVAASALLHGSVLALVLWQMSKPPIVLPQGGELPVVVDLVMAETPAAAPVVPAPSEEAVTRAEIPVADPEPVAPLELAEAPPPVTLEEPPPPVVLEEPPPPIESSVAEIVPPPPPEAKPEPRPEPKPAVTRRTVPPPKPAQPTPQVAASAPSGEEKPALLLPRPGSIMMSEQAMVSPIVPPVPVGPPMDYVGLIRQHLDRVKQYPRVAQQRRLQGEAMLTITIDRGGRVLSYRLVRGTGHIVLDREIEEMVRRASPLPPIPARMKTERLEIVVPVEFSLDG